MTRRAIQETVNEFPKEKIVKTEEGWIIRDVVLLSEFSKNVDPQSGKARRYTRECQEKAVKLFTDVPVNINHLRKDPSNPRQERDVRTTIGKVVAPRTRMLKRDGKIEYQTLGDIVLVKCESADQIAGLAKLNPKGGPGMSLTGDGQYDVDESYANIVDLEPATVDVVATPATTKGFFESKVEPVSEAFPPPKKGAQKPGDKKPIPSKKPAPDAQKTANKPAGDDTSAKAGEADGAQQDKEKPGQKSDAAMGKADKTADQEYDPKDPDGDGDDDTTPEGDTDGSHYDENGQKRPEMHDENGNPKGPDGDGSGDADGMDDGCCDIDAVTSEANMATDAANSDKTAQSHFDAMFAHAGAAGQIYKAGNIARAKAHYDKSRQHEGIALNLKQNDAAQKALEAPMSDQEKTDTSPIQAVKKNPKLESCAPWVRKLFEEC